VSASSRYRVWFKKSFLDLPHDVAEAARDGKRLMLYFGQDGCPYCAELFNNNFSQAHIVEYTRRHFDAIDFNLWGDREVTDFSGNTLPEKEFAAKLKVWFTPTLLFFNEKGEQVLRVNGYYPPHQFMAALRYVAEKQESRMTFREYLAQQAPPPAKGVLQPQPFFAKPPHDLGRIPVGKPVAVFFEQKDCAGCDRLHAEILGDAATREQLKRFHVIQLDRWGDTPVVTPGREENRRAPLGRRARHRLRADGGVVRRRQGSDPHRGHVPRLPRAVGAGLRRLRRLQKTARAAALHPRTRRPPARAGHRGGPVEMI
jgi:thioredoxin-related protein